MNSIIDTISSLVLGQTITHLFIFERGSSKWLFTNAVQNVSYNGEIYKSIKGLKFPRIKDESIDKADIEITFSQLNDFSNSNGEMFDDVFINMIFIEKVSVKILEIKNNSSIVLFIGRVAFPNFDEETFEMTLNCVTAESHLARNIQTRKFQSSCANTLFDRFCGLKFDDWAVELIVTSVVGNVVNYTVKPTQVVIDGVPQYIQVQATDSSGKLLYEQKQSVDANGNPLYEQKQSVDANGNPMFDAQGNPIMENDLSKPIMEDDLTKPIMIDGPPLMEIKVYPDQYFNSGILNFGGLNIHVISNPSGSLQLYTSPFGLAADQVVKASPGCDQTQSGNCSQLFNNAERAHVFMTVPNENPVYTNIMK